MLEHITSVPGKEFLYLFAMLIAILIAFAWYYGQDESLRFGVPPVTRFDPTAIAALEGVSHVIRTAVFGLWSRNQIKIQKDGDDHKLSANVFPEEVDGAVEKRILKFLEVPRDAEELFSKESLKADLQKVIEPVENRLRNSHLLKDSEQSRQGWKVLGTFLFILMFPGGLKMGLGMYHYRPVGYLFLEIVLGIILLVLCLKPWRKTTALGNRYLNKMKEHFKWVKDSVKDGKLPNGLNPELAIALFGTSILAGASFFSPYMEAFQRSQHGNTAGCGGCGSDSSGGGCSGGCGGCGGCGG